MEGKQPTSMWYTYIRGNTRETKQLNEGGGDIFTVEEALLTHVWVILQWFHAKTTRRKNQQFMYAHVMYDHASTAATFMWQLATSKRPNPVWVEAKVMRITGPVHILKCTIDTRAPEHALLDPTPDKFYEQIWRSPTRTQTS